MISLPETPSLTRPDAAVRVSYLTGEQADCVQRRVDTDWLGPASEDFDAHLDERRAVTTRWGVPSSVWWYTAGEHYLGTLVIRHQLTADLARAGGHIGYHVVAPWRRQGHATRMLTLGLLRCGGLGLERVLLTCDPGNDASRRVILANGGVADGRQRGEDRYWCPVPHAAADGG